MGAPGRCGLVWLYRAVWADCLPAKVWWPLIWLAAQAPAPCLLWDVNMVRHTGRATQTYAGLSARWVRKGMPRTSAFDLVQHTFHQNQPPRPPAFTRRVNLPIQIIPVSPPAMPARPLPPPCTKSLSPTEFCDSVSQNNKTNIGCKGKGSPRQTTPTRKATTKPANKARKRQRPTKEQENVYSLSPRALRGERARVRGIKQLSLPQGENGNPALPKTATSPATRHTRPHPGPPRAPKR